MFCKHTAILFIVLAGITVVSFAADTAIPFDETNWELGRAKVVKHLDRDALVGSANLKDVAFTDGTIQVDIACTGARSYPGIVFRSDATGTYEIVYLRPHHGTTFEDVVQYTPTYRNVSCWQLFNGPGKTASADLRPGQWITLKLEISGDRCRAFLDDDPQPVLDIQHLALGTRSGAIGVHGPANGSAFFSNFRYTKETHNFGTPWRVETMPGVIQDWELSRVFPFDAATLDQYPDNGQEMGWETVTAGPDGLVNVSALRSRANRAGDLVYAKTTITSETNRILKLEIGYSDVVTVFLDGKPLFAGNSAYRSRDASFAGIIGYHDVLYLPLKAGDNELLLAIAESFGGWAFMCRDGAGRTMPDGAIEKWTTTADFRIPESVVFDRKRDCFYISNFDQGMTMGPGKQYISRLNRDGSVRDLHWIPNIQQPLGMVLRENRLYVTERKAIAVVNVETAAVEKRIPLPGAVFPNDITMDDTGMLYVTDTRKKAIYRIQRDAAEVWLTGPAVDGPNTIYFHNGKIIWGNSNDGCLKSVDPATKQVTVLANLGTGFIDGIRPDGNGNLLVSLWRGRLFRVHPDGAVDKIIDTSVTGRFIADFEYLPEEKLLLIPGFYAPTVRAVHLP